MNCYSKSILIIAAVLNFDINKMWRPVMKSILVAVTAIFFFWACRSTCEPIENAPRGTTTNLCPKTLAKITKDRVIVDDDALLCLMNREEVQNKPLMILSIAGKMRTGKSFLMNLFVRYLRNHGWNNSMWYDDEQLVVGDFPYRSGVNPETRGIEVHPEIFQMPLNDRDQAAVILVDTQGLFDPNTPDCNAKQMALSILLSSHQILNTKGYVDERDLEHLLVSIQVARNVFGLFAGGPSDQVCTKKGEFYDRCESSGSVFQALSFVVRDWESEGDYPLGESDGYLDFFLRPGSSSADVKEVKYFIRKAFRDVNCYLLPHPGKKVARAVGNVENIDMPQDFANASKFVVESIMHHSNFSPKKNFGGGTATADELMHMIARVGRSLKDGSFKVETIHEILQKGELDRILISAVSAYKAKRKEVVQQQKFFAEKDLELFHNAAFDIANKKFAEESKLVRNRGLVKDYLEQLEKECTDAFSSLKNINSLIKDTILQNATQAIRQKTEEYETKSEGLISRASSAEELNRLLQTAAENAMAGFETEFAGILEDVRGVKTAKEELRLEIEEVAKNQITLWKMSNSAKGKNVAEGERHRFKLIEEFHKMCDEFSNEYHENLENMLEGKKLEVMAKFDEKVKGNAEEISSSRDKLEENLSAIVTNALEKNGKKRGDLEQMAELLGSHFAEILELTLREDMNKKYIEPLALNQTIEEAIEQYKESFENIPEWVANIAEKKARMKGEEIMERNRHNKDHRSFTRDRKWSWKNIAKIGGRALGILIDVHEAYSTGNWTRLLKIVLKEVVAD